MVDSSVLKWKQKGDVFLWTYLENRKNYPGWHLSADKTGADSLLSLLDRMMNAEWPSVKEIKISPPPRSVLRIPNNKNGRAKWQSPRVLEVKYSKAQVPENYWKLEVKENHLILKIGADKLKDLSKGVEHVIERRGDYAIGPDMDLCHKDSCLWFW